MNQTTLNQTDLLPKQVRIQGAGGDFPTARFPLALDPTPAPAPSEILGPDGYPVRKLALTPTMETVLGRIKVNRTVPTRAALAKAKPPIFLDGLLRRQEVMLISAESKANKSWAVMALMVKNELAALYPEEPLHWMGRKISPCHLIYLNFELTEAQFLDRIRTMFEALDDKGELWKRDMPLNHTTIIDLKGLPGLTADTLVSTLEYHLEGLPKHEREKRWLHRAGSPLHPGLWIGE